MKLTGVHFLLTYRCNVECDHCFVWGSPRARGAFTLKQIKNILAEAKKLKSVDYVSLEGGEPFLYYQTMLWGLHKAKDLDFRRSIVTNAYWATSVEDAKEWLMPILEIGIHNIAISDDIYHYGEVEENLAKNAYKAAKDLGLPVDKITIEDPKKYLKKIKWKGKPVVGGKVQFKGRAVEKLVEGLPTTSWRKFNKCQDEDFSNQGRVHIDPFGYVHVCQGITIGNMKQTPLPKLIADFNPEKHPILNIS